MSSDRGKRAGERGSASLELVGTLPFLILALLVAAQLALAGGSLWSAAIAARAGARAAAVGGAPRELARSALPGPLRAGARIDARDAGMSVEVPVPRLLPGLPEFGVEARTRLAPHG
jgi:hypothetical protein